MKSLNGQNVDMEQSPAVETYWVVDVFGQNDKIKRKSRRPPTFHAEEYAAFLRRVVSSSGNNNGSVVDRLYGPSGEQNQKSRSSSDGAEKSRQPTDLSDALRKLRQDLTSSFASFSKEFSGDTCDGVSLLMDVLRAVQMAQKELSDSGKEMAGGRGNRRLQIRTATSDELEVLLSLHQLCLANGHVPGKDHGCSRLMAHSGGFYGLALSLVSNLTKTRSVALQLMTAICKMAKGHSRVSEALTTLRLNMGEPVRMKLLTGIINSAASRVETLTESNKSGSNESAESSLRFLVEAMAFLNAFVHSAPDLRNQVVIQWEVEEAALNIHALSKVAESTRSPLALQLKQQLQLWADNQMDVSLLLDRLTNVTSTNEALRKDLQNLRSRLLDLEIEKRRFAEFENDMKQRCKELETELATLRSTSATSPSTSSMSVGTDTRPSDTEEPVVPRKDSRQTTLKRSSALYDDEDYTIDDVIAELNNIVNSAESDMNTENDTESIREQLVTPNRMPHPPRRTESKSSIPPLSPAVRLSEDLGGETSDYPATQSDELTDSQNGVLSVDSRKKLYFGQNAIDERLFQSQDAIATDNERRITENLREVEERAETSSCSASPENAVDVSDETDRSSDVLEEKIQPDILRTIPSRLFQKPWNVVEACSPLFMENGTGGPARSQAAQDLQMLARTRPVSLDDIARLSAENPLLIDDMPRLEASLHSKYETSYDGDSYADQNPALMYRESEDTSDGAMSDSPIDRAASLGDLQIGDVFSFQYSNPGSEIGGANRNKKSKRMLADKASRYGFNLANFIPGFLKPNPKPTRQEWEAFQTERALMKDYRQNFRRSPAGHLPVHVAAAMTPYNDLQFWPATFQALPYRNIPTSQPALATFRRDRNRSAPSPSQMVRTPHTANRGTKLMDHPSGLY